MLSVYKHLAELDRAATARYALSEEILMENAARGVYEFLKENGLEKKKTVILTGGGNNGADGLALSRMLPNSSVYVAIEPKSELCKLQFERASKLGVPITNKIDGFEVIIDAIFGSGGTKPIEGELKELILSINRMNCVKIAIDIPSGVRDGMERDDAAFVADFTVTLGAHKEALYGDYAKDFVGEIVLKELGLLGDRYTDGFEPDSYLLEKSDFKAPARERKNCNKGDFGHLCVIGGEMIGASVIAARAALRFGVGLVTITERDEPIYYEPQIMVKNSVPQGANTILIGQGLGEAFDSEEIISFVQKTEKCVIDADIFKKNIIKDILSSGRQAILTPHPKEFCSLLKIAADIELDVNTLQKDRFGYLRAFSKKYPSATIVLKGANTLIARGDRVFIMPFGSAALAKAGSGDTLGGVIAALLAQGYEPLDAAINGSLALAFAAEKFKGADYSMTVEDLHEGLKWI